MENNMEDTNKSILTQQVIHSPPEPSTFDIVCRMVTLEISVKTHVQINNEYDRRCHPNGKDIVDGTDSCKVGFVF
jgi:hypothetical protein